MIRSIVVFVAAALAAPALGQAARIVHISPVEAIQKAADAAPRGVRGRFVMTVRGVGRVGGRLYLNSEADYRDQRNLSVAVQQEAVRDLLRRADARRDRQLVGRRVTIDGVAERVRIDFTHNRRPTGKYYYQTHVRVTRSGQISFLD